MRRIYIFVILGLLAAATVSAQDARNGGPAKSPPIERVMIRGHRRIPTSTIKSWIAIRKGDSYSAEQLDRALRDLFDTGHFFDVKVYVEDGLRRGKIVTIEVTENPLIQEIAYEGIDEATQAEVREEWRRQNIDLSQGSEYDPARVKRAAASIRDVIVKRGNQRAKVNPIVERKTQTSVSIVFNVEQ